MVSSTIVKLWRIATTVSLIAALMLALPSIQAEAASMAHQVTNVGDKAFTVTWTTSTAETGYVKYSTNPESLTNIASDDRGQTTEDDTHHVSISSLTAETTYYYEIVSGGTTYNNEGSPYELTTGPGLGFAMPEMINGTVYKSDGTTVAEGAILYAQIGTSQILSSLVNDQGVWGLNIAPIRNSTYQSYYSHSDSSESTLSADGSADGTTSQTLTIAQVKAGSLEMTLAVALAADFTADIVVADVDETIQFTDATSGGVSPYTYEWDFDNDGTVDSTEASPTHAYTSAGTYTVSLTVTDNESATDTKTRTDYINVAETLVAGFSADIVVADIDETIQFTDATTGGTSPYTYRWDFENDGTVDSTEASPTHAYSSAGTYTVKLTVFDSLSRSDSETKTDYINAAETLVAAFSADIVVADIGESIQFTDATAGGVTPYTYAWDFDNDGTADSTEASPSYAYSTSGTFTVDLAVTDALSRSDSETKTNYITVPATLVANFTADQTEAGVGTTIQFTNTSTGGVAPFTYAWDFNNDGTTDSTEASPTHIYNTDGSYTVSLTVTDSRSSEDSETKTNYITALPVSITHQLTNIGDKAFTVTWFTSEAKVGYVKYGTSAGSLTNIASDDRGQTTEDDTHHVSITGLAANTTYYYMIVCGGVTYNNEGAPYEVTTGPSLSFTMPEMISGTVYKEDGTTPAEGAIIFASIGDSQVLSTLVDSSGLWGLNIAAIREADFQSYYTHADEDEITIQARGGNDGTASQAVTITEAKAGTLEMTLMTYLTADFSADETAPGVGDTVQFSDLTAGGTSPYTYEWDFDNDGTVDSTEASPSHVYTSSGTYTVSLTVTDNESDTDTETKTDYITVVDVLVSITVFPASPEITLGDQLQFKAIGTYTDGSKSDITTGAGVNWTSSVTAVADIAAGTGLASTAGKAAGTTVITATHTGRSISGNTTLTVLADKVAPVVTLASPTEGLVLSDTALTVSGNVDDTDATATVIVNGGTPAALTLDGSGDFSQAVTLSVGSNTVLVRAVDASGNTGTSGTRTVVVDPNKPDITITSPTEGTLTNNATLSVTGTITGAETASLILNGSSQTVTPTSGSFTAEVILAEGTNIIVVTAYATDHEGEADYLGTSGVRKVKLDTTAPVVDIDSPVSGSVVNKAGVAVSGTVDDPAVTSVNVTLNSGTPQAVSVIAGNFSIVVTLEAGENTIEVAATDTAGNSSSDSVQATLDTTKPRVTITSPANKLLTKLTSLDVTGTVSDTSITTATLLLNGSSQSVTVTNGSFSKTVTLSSGANTIEVTATDAATNTGTSGEITVTVDTTSPTLVVGLNDPTDSITITVTSGEALQAAPTITVDPVIDPTGTTQKISINKWSRTDGSSASPIPAGAYTITISGTDKAGNTTTKTVTFAKQTIDVDGVDPTTVSTASTTLEVETDTAVNDVTISVTQHLENPSGNAGNPTGATVAAAFVEIIASPELRNNLNQIYIEVSYDPDELASGTDESTLRLYVWDVSAGVWSEVEDSGVNTTENYIYGTITHLSKYGGFGRVSSPPSGGGSAPSQPTGTTYVTRYIDSEGRFIYTVKAYSIDEVCMLEIPSGTIGLQANGDPLTSITILTTEDIPAAPAGSAIIGQVYDFGPDGATFSPAVTLTVEYDPNELPAGVSEEDLVLAFWDVDAGEWVILGDSAVDADANTISASVSHFTAFAVLSSDTRPAAFTCSGLTISPAEVEAGETVTISVTVSNSGDLEGTYQLVLNINGVAVATEDVTLAGGTSQHVSFTTAQDAAGEYTVGIGDLTGSFTVTTSAVTEPDEEPATFVVSNLSVSPAEVAIGETVTITVLVSNTGDLEGTYQLVLKIAGEVVATRSVTLAGGASQEVTFITTEEAAGGYRVDIDGESTTFAVTPSVTPSDSGETPEPRRLNWWLIGGAIAGVAFITLFALLIRRQVRAS
ncbi:MAG TPA: PKD domain-containing protein [Dehalococcoidia bacterium]|nr:PKD domain-containing protein [Dehalococcoidia bacterium]